MRKFLEFIGCPTTLTNTLTRPSFQDIKISIWKQDLQKIQQLITQGAPIHQKSQSILHYATIQNKTQAVQFITQNYTQLINQKNQDGDTSLMLALFYGNQKIIRTLLPLSNQNIRDNNGNTAFVIAAANGNNMILEVMLGSSCNNTMVRNFQGQTALHRAAYHGELQTIKLLLHKTNLRISQTDRNNNNALHMACMSCQLICARYMLCKMKDSYKLLQAKNKQDKTPIQLLKETINKLNSYKKSEKTAINIEEVLHYVLSGRDQNKIINF